MTGYGVIIPEEKYQILEFVQEEMPGIAVINIALRNFKPKVVFSWHLSIMIDFEDLIENGMPSYKEREVMDAFESQLDINIKGSNIDKSNGLFLGRITWNKTRELIWRIYDPEPVNQYLQCIINENDSPREFDYRIDPDEDWQLSEWHLRNR